jgi:hypothetical protein
MIPPLLTPYISLVAAITSVVNYDVIFALKHLRALSLRSPNYQCNGPGGSVSYQIEYFKGQNKIAEYIGTIASFPPGVSCRLTSPAHLFARRFLFKTVLIFL